MASLAGAAAAGFSIWRADHAGPDYDLDVAEGQAAVADQTGLDYLAHVTYGILDFALGAPAGWPAGDAMTPAIESAVRQLGLAVVQLDESCELLDCGVLTRMVLQGENGALFHTLKVMGQSVFGLTFAGGQDTVGRVGSRLAVLAGSSASRMGGSSVLDRGGFRSRENSGELWRPYERELPAADSGPTAIALGHEGMLPEAVAAECRRALHPGHLHYVAIYRRDQLLWSADIFDAPELAPLFQRVSPAARRRGYQHVLHQVDLQFRRFRQLLALVQSERLVRLVLDVARGAVYVLPLADDDFLVAVTLFQSQVDSADRRARALLSVIRESWSKAGLPVTRTR